MQQQLEQQQQQSAGLKNYTCSRILCQYRGHRGKWALMFQTIRNNRLINIEMNQRAPLYCKSVGF